MIYCIHLDDNEEAMAFINVVFEMEQFNYVESPSVTFAYNDGIKLPVVLFPSYTRSKSYYALSLSAAVKCFQGLFSLSQFFKSICHKGVSDFPL